MNSNHKMNMIAGAACLDQDAFEVSGYSSHIIN